jgi:hypothetical protein
LRPEGAVRPYWIVVEPTHGPSILNLGVGITAASEADARAMFAAAFGAAHRIAQVRAVMAADELDQKHVVPNMGNMLKCGV